MDQNINENNNLENMIPCEICNELINFHEYIQHFENCISIRNNIVRNDNNFLNIINLVNMVMSNDNESIDESIDISRDVSRDESRVESIDISRDESRDVEDNNINNIINEIRNNINNSNFNINIPSIIQQINNLNSPENIRRRTYQNISNFSHYLIRDTRLTNNNLVMSNRINNINKVIIQIDENEIKPDDICPICLDNLNNVHLKNNNNKSIKLLCNHIFCYNCIKIWLNKNITCPICKEDLEKKLLENNDNNDIDMQNIEPYNLNNYNMFENIINNDNESLPNLIPDIDYNINHINETIDNETIDNESLPDLITYDEYDFNYRIISRFNDIISVNNQNNNITEHDNIN